ncbi:carbohydrate ABC transporter permease [Gracilibacillus alcaliphilus]|uniref:carbohydrate ABC transporter permease n=1 Tax=Gracilibacillus alcaliphilus TaxID=1401441 RepID=UPI00195BF943|nr:sugar ABC transporter permease [Gracilibacillus alcaliphilus]MBM7677671.1 multiple sugar transport system permease protein [Gracilibacillus alcaliphilus]
MPRQTTCWVEAGIKDGSISYTERVIFMQGSMKRSTKWKLAMLLILPVLLIRGFTIVYPLIVTFINSFFEINMFKGGEATFVGLQNFASIFTDGKIIASVNFTIVFTVVSMIFHVILGLGLALLLNMKFKGKKFLRTITLIPWAMPMVVTGIAAKWAFNDSYGLVNDLIRRIAPEFQFDWLIHPWSAQLAVILVDLWKDIPFFAILLLAGLQFIPEEIYESAKIDGAGHIKSFFKITLPMVTPTLLTLCIFFTMWRITMYDLVYAMTSGGPGDSTSLLAYRIAVEAFTNLNIGYASALALMLFLIMIVFSSINLLFIKKAQY